MIDVSSVLCTKTAQRCGNSEGSLQEISQEEVWEVLHEPNSLTLI